ncbi:MAG TPA: HAMP domain-containing sensor histidine kinase [Solirubrobacteraceae bacterium]|nr:HAMP domain-containing sensor histidine kinase [Solirubrobacteraceae bacterium]
MSLSVRVAGAAAGSVLVAVALLGVAAVLLVRHELYLSLDAALRERAQEVAQLAVSTPAVLDEPGALESPLSGRQALVEVLDARGRILARSLSLGARVLPQDALARAARLRGATGVQTIQLGGRPLRLYAAPIASGFGPAAGGAVLVASDTSDISATTGRLGALIALVGGAIALVAAAAAALLVRRGLRPLRALADVAGEVQRTADPSHRLPDDDSRDEVGRLTRVLNGMLAALARARDAERRLIADASHELRTPVTSLLGNVQYAARHGADEEILDELAHDAARLASLVDSLLALERAGTPAPAAAARPVALDDLARAVVAQEGQRVTVGELAALSVEGDPDALARALGNLVRNGLVHGPPGGKVRVDVARDGGQARISVSDEGPGPAPELHDRLFERFWRGPGAAARPGSGLGLAIVAAVAQAHGGRVSVDGSTFSIHLPLAGRADGGGQAAGERSRGAREAAPSAARSSSPGDGPAS